MSPGTARKIFGILMQLDVRHVLGAIRVPTLILHRVDDKPVSVENSRYLAARIAGAKYVELPGADHIPWFGDVDGLLAEVSEFLTGERLYHAAQFDSAIALAGGGSEPRHYGSISSDLHSVDKVLAKLRKAHPEAELKFC